MSGVLDRAQPMVDFFISYNKADKAWAIWIAWQLETVGFSVIIQDWDFRPGSNFALKMHEAIASSERTIAVISSDFLKSAYAAPEWAAAFTSDPTGANRKLVPVRVRDCEPEGVLPSIVYIDLVGRDESEAQRELLDGLKERRAKPSTPPVFPGTGPERPTFPGSTSGSSSARRPAGKPRAAGATSQDLTSTQAKGRVDAHEWGVRGKSGRGWTGDVWLGAVVVPERQAAPYIDVLELGAETLRDELGALALSGASAVFRRNRPTKETEKADHLLFEQTDDGMRGTVASLEVHTDGTIVYRTTVERRASRGHSLADSILIDEDAVTRAISAFVSFAGGFFEQRGRDPGHIYLGVSLSDLQHKHFGRIPNYPMNSFTVGDPRVANPLKVPDDPLKITNAQLSEPDAVAKTMVAYIARAFRLEDAYFVP